MSTEAPERRVHPARWLLAVTLVAGSALLAAALVSYARSDHGRTSAPTVVPAPVVGLPATTRRRAAVYTADDPWRAYLADERTCPGGSRTDLPLAEQADVMICLVDYARLRRGLAPLLPVPLLNASALAKANRIVRCRTFAHDACGEAAEADARAYGYQGPFGENLYVGENGFRAPRAAVDGWLNSKGHRVNLFRPAWSVQGLAVETVPRFGPYRGAAVWVIQFGVG